MFYRRWCCGAALLRETKGDDEANSLGCTVPAAAVSVGRRIVTIAVTVHKIERERWNGSLKKPATMRDDVSANRDI